MEDRMNLAPKFDYYTVRRDGDSWIVHGFGTYERSSVLAGQPRKVFLDAFPTREAALEQYPTATNGSRWTDPVISLDHLPGEDDPVPGGMYPDDYDDGEN
jgi:hypothetical protein